MSERQSPRRASSRRGHATVAKESVAMPYDSRREDVLAQVQASLDKLNSRLEKLDETISQMQQRMATDSQRLSDHSQRLTTAEGDIKELTRSLYLAQRQDAQQLGQVTSATQAQIGQVALGAQQQLTQQGQSNTRFLLMLYGTLLTMAGSAVMGLLLQIIRK